MKIYSWALFRGVQDAQEVSAVVGLHWKCCGDLTGFVWAKTRSRVFIPESVALPSTSS